MKHWILGAALFAATGVAQAENYRIVQSPSQKLDVWIDNIKGNTAQSWCANEVALRIVANGNKNVKILDNFLPRVGALMEHQCSRLQQLNWTLVDANNGHIAQGSAAKNKKWAVKVTPAETAAAAEKPVAPAWLPPEEKAEKLSPAADRTPWQEFTLQGGCRLRTFWQENAAALFIPAVESGSCEKGGWLSGRTVITQSVNGKEKQSTVTFVHGFPVLGLNAAADPNKLLITAVNNQRMVVSNENAQQSWMILPYVAGQNGWQMTGTLAIEMSQELANDPSRLQARIEAARSVWTPWLAPDIKLNVVLIDGLHPLLRNPAAGAWRAAN
ncbi:hypothetical protein [Klebsiella aerogenes]|uniref:hypothetical protein n=1 Tax=Klebsiella aerogenes TaxID=548 RepID=UPI000C767808|nr:hypothetical protein [Klebsiella aerogenes]ELA1992065.1 hypothetical protein [Klebsiella aerogenes]MDN3810712.1 hypothetical protein [Klebsiella aerogenes]HCB3047820.1 hypothetical protein [Klebsiella aerogenes]HCB3603156.1 hypothetical protein [Klebsiella aerogenes]HCM1701184.1 hypothetical protein [Klebsiella aerogenes]